MVLASVGSGGVMEGEGSDRENVGGNVNIKNGICSLVINGMVLI